MNYQKLVEVGLLKKQKTDFKQIIQIFKRASRNLSSAKILVKNDDEDGAYRFAYEAMLLAGRALTFSLGFRPKTVGSHKIIVDFSSKILGKDFQVLMDKFSKMRQKRNYLIYGVGLTVSKTEAENAIKTATEFVKKIEEYIEIHNPQKKLTL